MCGDGPAGPLSRTEANRVAPRVRGWTLAGHAAVGDFHGCPACAGMDPRRAPGRARPARLPRVCGDGPIAAAGAGATQTVAPRVRGWTRGGAARGLQRIGCPACAGMDPSVRAASGSAAWLPRVCGDGPVRPQRRHRRARVAPRVRGWTLAEWCALWRVEGCPACAGMDPARPRGHGRAPRLPRVCGDGPARAHELEVRQAVAPRVRGWTRRQARPVVF